MKSKRPGVFDNLGIKVVALVGACILWLLVTSINDPITESRFTNIPVKLVNTNLITERGEVYSVLDNSDTVPIVTVRARRSVRDRINRENIVATADVEDLSSVDTIEIKYSLNAYGNDVDQITGSVGTVKLSIEKRKTSTFALQTETNGDVAAGYQLGVVSPEQNQIRVSGPESVVSSIASAVAVVDVSNATASISTYSDIRLYDAEGSQVSTDNLTLNITSVKVNVAVLPLKDIPVTVETSGTPADGYMLNGTITTDPSTIGLAGRTSVLTAVDSIVIPASVVNIEGLSSNFEADIDVTPYLPEGTTFEDTSFNGYVHVTVGIEEAETASVYAEFEDVELTNVPDGYSARLLSIGDGTTAVSAATENQQFQFDLSGLKSEIEAFAETDLEPTVDVGAMLQDLDESNYVGSQQAVVRISLPSSVTQLNTVTAVVSITQQNQTAADNLLTAPETETTEAQ